MLTEKLIGYFDVRRYAPNVEKAQQVLKADTETITFTTRYDADKVPEDLQKYAKITDKGVYVSFKINARCRWFNGAAQPVARPTNAELDVHRYEVCIDYRQLNGDPSKQEACGYWANAIQFEEAVENPFQAWHEPVHEPTTVEVTDAQPQEAQSAQETQEDVILPF